MKKKSPILVYLLTWITFGVYFFYWIFSMMRDLNSLSDQVKFEVKKNVIMIITILVPYLIIFFVMPYLYKSPFFLLLWFFEFALAILWFILTVRNLVRICNAIAFLEDELKIEKKITGGLTILLFFLWFTGTPYIQIHMNKVIDMKYGSGR